jgi:uncharacterized protein YjeT (DUF2065 family)
MMSMEWRMWAPGRIILEIAAVLVTVGGLFDVFTPHLPQRLVMICGGNVAAQKLTRELLRALGGALVAIGAASTFLVTTSGGNPDPSTLVLILLLIGPAEFVNAFSMFRVGSPFYFPLAFASLAILGAALWWPHHLR